MIYVNIVCCGGGGGGGFEENIFSKCSDIYGSNYEQVGRTFLAAMLDRVRNVILSDRYLLALGKTSKDGLGCVTPPFWPGRINEMARPRLQQQPLILSSVLTHKNRKN